MSLCFQLTRDVPMGMMIGSADEIQLLQNMIRNMGGKNCLDIGEVDSHTQKLNWTPKLLLVIFLFSC